MAKYIEEHYKDKTIDVTGDQYYQCSFTNCVLTCNDTSANFDYLKGGNFYDKCTLMGSGWPAWMKPEDTRNGKTSDQNSKNNTAN